MEEELSALPPQEVYNGVTLLPRIRQRLRHESQPLHGHHRDGERDHRAWPFSQGNAYKLDYILLLFSYRHTTGVQLSKVD